MISILTPTRKRVAELERMVGSVRATMRPQFRRKPSVEVIAYVDDDDELSAAACDRMGIKYKVGPRILLTKCWNELLPLADGQILMQGNDDIVFRTVGWDELVENAFAECDDKILMIHGSDDAPKVMDMGREKFGPHPLVHRRWVDALGYFIAPYFSSDYGDTWLNDVANALGRRRYIPFVAEHMHVIYGKSKEDEVTRERLKRHYEDHVDDLYRDLLPQRMRDVEKLRALIGTTVVWTIMILTQPSRREFLAQLMDALKPQVAGQPVEIAVQQFDEGLSLGENREQMRRAAKGAYICFVDDDDMVAERYVASILPVLKRGAVDYVGFQLQCNIDGKDIEPTYHSLRYKEWNSDSKGHYRHVSHLNPMRKELALSVPMEGGVGEDHRWADAVYATGRVKNEYYVNDIMYRYNYRSQKQDARPQCSRSVAERDANSPVVNCPGCHCLNAASNEKCRRCRIQLKKHTPSGVSNWRPTYNMCPECRSTCVIPFSNGLHCNQCGLAFV